MKPTHLFLIALIGIFFIEGRYIIAETKNVENRMYNTALAEGFKVGVECRGMLTAESCYILFEASK